MYRRLSNLRMARLLSCSAAAKLFDVETTRRWTTYGTARRVSLFHGVVHDDMNDSSVELAAKGVSGRRT